MSFYQRIVYPFTVLAGQEKMKRGLILNAINPRLGGILIRGEKGTAKSTAVRALAGLLPEIEVVAGCPFCCDPDNVNAMCIKCRERLQAGETLPHVRRKMRVVELPVSATEDRVVGTLDIERAIKQGEKHFEPGVLARANRGILYVDEVNLLDDHIVDILLDAAAMGVNAVEREGVSFAHRTDFILVGTMNPEEGELRPQLLDRFGLCVAVSGVDDLQERVTIIRRREAFDADPLWFMAMWAEAEKRLQEKILAARRLLPSVLIGEEHLAMIARMSMEALTAGHRADVIMAAAARTIAAFNGRVVAGESDVLEAAELVLLHRVREAPPPAPSQSESPWEEPENEPDTQTDDRGETLEQAPETLPEQSGQDGGAERDASHNEGGSEEDNQPEHSGPPVSEQEIVFGVGAPFRVKRIDHGRDRVLRQGSGRRSRSRTANRNGRYVRSTMQRQNNDLALDATLRAAAPHQLHRRHNGLALIIKTADIREKVREKRIGDFLLFLVDASGSMGAQQRMVETKGAILSLLLDAYQKRDKIGLIAFKGSKAEVLLPPTGSMEMGHKLLAEMPTGGKTPLAAGLLKAYEVVNAHLFKEPDMTPLLILISDGRGNVSMGEDKPMAEAFKVAELINAAKRIKILVVDVEKNGFVTFGLARELAVALGAEYCRIDDLKAETLVQTVREMQWE